MHGRFWFRFALPLACMGTFAATAAAQDEVPASAPYGLGPFEVAPAPGIGGLGAPRSAVPETRFGVLLHWMMQSQSTPIEDVSGNILGLILEGHLELFDVLEVGIDIEALQYWKIDYPSGSPVADRDDADFGFLTPRAKFAFLRGDNYTLSFGLGIALPTGTGPQFDHNVPIGFDPGLFFGFRLLDMISINASLPVLVMMNVPDEGDTQFDTLLNPSVGVAVMPIDLVGGFLDLGFRIWVDPEDGADAFQALNLVFGVRSNFMPWMMGEVGAILPVAGDAADLYDFGMGFRIVANPDFL